MENWDWPPLVRYGLTTNETPDLTDDAQAEDNMRRLLALSRDIETAINNGDPDAVQRLWNAARQESSEVQRLVLKCYVGYAGLSNVLLSLLPPDQAERYVAMRVAWELEGDPQEKEEELSFTQHRIPGITAMPQAFKLIKRIAAIVHEETSGQLNNWEEPKWVLAETIADKLHIPIQQCRELIDAMYKLGAPIDMRRTTHNYEDTVLVKSRNSFHSPDKP